MNEMPNPSVNETFFQLLQCSLFPDRVKGPEEITDWEAVYTEMRDQTVDALPYKWLKSHPASDNAVYKSWVDSCMASQAQWVRVMHGQEELLRLLEAHDIPCVILKGTAAAMAYPNPTLRRMGDVDFLVKRCDRDRAAQVLEQNGYQLCAEKYEDIHHYAYSREKISFELHWRLGSIGKNDEEHIRLFEDGIDHRVSANIGDFLFPVLPVEMNGMVLLLHINQHLRDGLGLRQIVDWMMYLNENDGMDRLIPLLKRTGMERFALSVTAMCQKYLGLKHFVDDTEQYPCDALMDYILSKGNFGRKTGFESRISSFGLGASNPVHLLKRLQKGGLNHWDASKRHAILRPFAWLYQIGYISAELIRHGATPGEIKTHRSEGAKRRNLIYSLGLDVENTIKKIPHD